MQDLAAWVGAQSRRASVAAQRSLYVVFSVQIIDFVAVSLHMEIDHWPFPPSWLGTRQAAPFRLRSSATTSRKLYGMHTDLYSLIALDTFPSPAPASRSGEGSRLRLSLLPTSLTRGTRNFEVMYRPGEEPVDGARRWSLPCLPFEFARGEADPSRPQPRLPPQRVYSAIALNAKKPMLWTYHPV